MIRALQQAIYANKVAKGFNVTDAPLEFCYLSSKGAEAFEGRASRRRRWRCQPRKESKSSRQR